MVISHLSLKYEAKWLLSVCSFHRSHKKHANNASLKPAAATVEEPSTPRRQSVVLQNGNNFMPADTSDTTSEQFGEALVSIDDATSEVTFKEKPIQQITAQTVNVDRITIMSNSVSHSQPPVDNKVHILICILYVPILI